jgi:hypothetical protein
MKNLIFTIVILCLANLLNAQNYTYCGNNNDKVLICHHGMTLCVSMNAVQAHLNHGDFLGNCTDTIPPPKSPVGENNFTPDKFILSQNFPNPFNPETNINFSIPVNAFVSLKVYDITGKEVASLISENMNAGTYSVVWNASEYTSGVYFYKIETGNFSDVKRMTLVK